MNGGLYSANNNTSAPSEVDLKASNSPVETNGHTIHQVDVINGNSGQTPIHIPAAKRLGGHWATPTSVASTTAPFIDTNGSSASTASLESSMAVSAATSPYSSSHYSSLAASAEAVRRGGATPTGGAITQDTKPGLSFWQSDYHKYSAAAAASAGTPSTTQGTTSPSVTMAAVAASECSQMSAAAGFAAHQAAAWNYPHPGQYAAALASPEQAAAEAARARQMAADTAGFHADYTRLQYPPDGIYSHPPGKTF